MKHCLPIRKIKFNPYDSSDEALPFMVLGPDSPFSYRQAVGLLAEDFANSTGFSPAPYEPKEGDHYGKAYLRDRLLVFSKLVGEGKICFCGAVGMRWKRYEFTDMPEAEGWFMTWAWFHPNERRKGYLSNAWPYILKLFPDFMPQPPATMAMGSFLKKMKFNHPYLLHGEFPTVTPLPSSIPCG